MDELRSLIVANSVCDVLKQDFLNITSFIHRLFSDIMNEDITPWNVTYESKYPTNLWRYIALILIYFLQ